MFSNLSNGSVLYGIDRRGEMKWFTGSVERITPSINQQYKTNFGQFPSISLDIIANINGEQKEFKQVPSNDIIADFGQNAFIIADNKDSLCNYVKTLLKKSEDVVSSVETHKALIPQYNNILAELIPGMNNNNEVKELKEQVGNLQSQLKEALALLRQGNKKQE